MEIAKNVSVYQTPHTWILFSAQELLGTFYWLHFCNYRAL